MKYKMLNEDISYDEIKSQPYFNQFKNLRLYHGSRNKINEPTLIPFRFREKSVDTPTELHDTINSISEEKLGVPVRNLKFVYTREIQVLPYGKPHILVPKGEFKLYAVTGLYDLTTTYDLDMADSNFFNNIFEVVCDKLKHELESFSFQVSNDEVMKILDNLISAYMDAISQFHQSNIKESFYEYILFHIGSLIDKSNLGELEETVKTIIHKIVNQHYINFAHEYIDSVGEIKTDSDYEGDNAELMLYAPNGMYVIPEYHKIYNTLS